LFEPNLKLVVAQGGDLRHLRALSRYGEFSPIPVPAYGARGLWASAAPKEVGAFDV